MGKEGGGGGRDAPSCAMAFACATICCASFKIHFSVISGVGDGKSTGTTFESAKEQRTKSECKKRMCWYATRRGQKNVKRVVCASSVGSEKSAEESVEEACGAGEGLRMKSIS